MTNPHTVTVTLDDEGIRDEVRFECSAARTDRCHVYPDDREEWSEEEAATEGVEHDECWIAGWFDAEAYDYVGSDAVEGEPGVDSVPPIARSGTIDTSFEIEYIRWAFEPEQAS